jgi:CRISPR-associated protein Cas5t
MSGQGLTTALYIEAPVVCFRVPWAREHVETYEVAPPSTVYGCLLSYVGEELRDRHAGASVAVAMLSRPRVSTVVRTMRRYKETQIDHPNNAKPDFQQLLTDVRLAVWVRALEPEGRNDRAAPAPLAKRLADALRDPASVTRYGGLSLGESAHMVNEVRALRESDLVHARLLCRTELGRLTLPIWPDHVGSAGTAWGRFDAVPFAGGDPPLEAFVRIAPRG